MRGLTPIDSSSAASGAAEWRRHRLVRAGFPARLAATVASDGRFDLHALLGLIDRGCAPELAVRIVAPLDEEGVP